MVSGRIAPVFALEIKRNYRGNYFNTIIIRANFVFIFNRYWLSIFECTGFPSADSFRISFDLFWVSTVPAI